MRKTIVGVMGTGEGATAIEQQQAYELGWRIAEQGWVLLTGGRNVGVMDAASRGAKQANGLTIGILPTADAEGVALSVDIAICTDLGNARNNINVLSSHLVIACGMGAGTASEVALALKANKSVILLNPLPESKAFFQSLSLGQVFVAETPTEAIKVAQRLLVF